MAAIAGMDCWSCHSHGAKIDWDDDASGMLDHRMLFALDDCPLLSPIAANPSRAQQSGSGGTWKRLKRSVCSYLHSGGDNGGGPAKIRHDQEKKIAWNAVVESLMQRHPGSQLPERLISMIRRHFESLPLSYAQAGLASDQVFLHIRLVEQAHSNPHSGSIAIAIAQESATSTATARSSNASEESLSMTTTSSPPSPASWDRDHDHGHCELLTITFATVGVPLTKQSIAWAFKRAAIPVRHTTLFSRKALFLGTISISSARGSMELDRIQGIFKAASKRSRLRKLALGLYGSSSSTCSSRPILVQNAARSIASSATAAATPDRELVVVSHRLSVEASTSGSGGGVTIRIDPAGNVSSSGGGEELWQWMLDSAKVIMSGAEEGMTARYGGEEVALEPINGHQDVEELELELQQEVLWLCTPPGMVAHANVLPIRGILHRGGRLWLVSRRVAGGSLRHVLDKRDKVELRAVLRIACDVAEGMQFLHECGIVHRNLNSSNILLDDNGSAVISGLRIETGTTTIKSAAEDETSFQDAEENPWLAPEVDSEKSLRTPKADVYSYGILLWELVACHCQSEHPSLEMPTTPRKSASRSRHPDVPLDCFPLLKYLMQQCWASSPAERPDFCEILDMVATATRDLTR